MNGKLLIIMLQGLDQLITTSRHVHRNCRSVHAMATRNVRKIDVHRGAHTIGVGYDRIHAIAVYRKDFSCNLTWPPFSTFSTSCSRRSNSG